MASRALPVSCTIIALSIVGLMFSVMLESTNSHLISKADKSASFPSLKVGMGLIAAAIYKVTIAIVMRVTSCDYFD